MESELVGTTIWRTGPQLAAQVFRRIVIPIDFTEESHAAVALALELKRRFGAELCAFNLTFLDEGEDGHARLESLLESVQPGASRDINVQICAGDDVIGWIHDVVTDWEATIVILATHPRYTVFRSLTEKMMRALKIPVLILA